VRGANARIALLLANCGHGGVGRGIVMTRTLRARSMAWFLDRRPTAAEPCLTASSAYSTWCNRPWGEKTVLSES
jgi:hypothetical protein